MTVHKLTEIPFRNIPSLFEYCGEHIIIDEYTYVQSWVQTKYATTLTLRSAGLHTLDFAGEI